MEDLNNNQVSQENRHHRHMTTKLVVISLIGVFILALGSSWIVNRFILKYNPVENLQINAEVIKKNELTARVAADIVRQQLNKLILIGSFYSSKKEIIQLIQKSKWQDAMNIVSSAFKEASGETIDRIAMFDITGTTMVNAPEQSQLIGQNFASRDWYRGVMASYKPYVSEVYIRASKPEFNVVGIAFPVNDGRGVPIAIILFIIRTDTFLKWLDEIRIGDSGVTFIVDQHAQVVAHPDIPPQGKIVDYSTRVDVQKAISGQSGTEITINQKSDRIMTSFEPISEFGWGVVTRITLDELVKNDLIKE